MFSHSPLADEINPSTAKDHSSRTSTLWGLQSYRKNMVSALERREQMLRDIPPLLLLRIRIRGGIRSFQTPKLPAPIQVTDRSGDLELDYLSLLPAASVEGIAREGAIVIQQVLQEMARNGVHLDCFSIFFVPLSSEKFTITP